MYHILNKPLASLQKITPSQALLLTNQLQLHTYYDLLNYFPRTYQDRTRFHHIKDIQDNMPYIQVKGTLGPLQRHTKRKKSILLATLSDPTGTLNLIWFNSIAWHQQHLSPNQTYIIWGKPKRFQNSITIPHPELQPAPPHATAPLSKTLQPVYITPRNLRKQRLDTNVLATLQTHLLADLLPHIPENLPTHLLQRHQLLPRPQAYQHIHFPKTTQHLHAAQRRLTFEKLFYTQLRIRHHHHHLQPTHNKSHPFSDTRLLHTFYKQRPFDLTQAQKKAIKTIIADMKQTTQMHRLLQGDVGSGKTIVAFISMLLPIAHKAQVAFMSPTTILAQQHYATLQRYATPLGITIALLTGHTPQKERRAIHQRLANGSIAILVGTHTLAQDTLQFHKLGLVVIDEQHRFGVAQRAKLHNKKGQQAPHILVMTATPIPRTLAMTLYNHLAISTIDQLPPNRLPVKTYHAYDKHRLRLFGFLKKKIQEGRQIYIVYPRIDHQSDDRYKDVLDGYESITRAFPSIHCGILHGRMAPENKAYELRRFAKGETHILVSSTVIEVGLNIPNATVMVIENAECFGLAQLHQLRGRIARSTHQAHCILMTKENLPPISQQRINTMVQTNDGFKIAEVDMALRGPGDLTGITQSGHTDLKIDIKRDYTILRTVAAAVQQLLLQDPTLQHPDHQPIKNHLAWLRATQKDWIDIG